MGIINKTPEFFLGVIKTNNKMKITEFIIGLMIFLTIIMVAMTHNRTIEEIKTLGVNQEKIDSLQREVDFREDMIRHYAKDKNADMVQYRIEAQEK